MKTTNIHPEPPKNQKPTWERVWGLLIKSVIAASALISSLAQFLR